MISLDRKEFRKALKFLIPAIAESAKALALNCLLVHVKSDEVVLSSGNGYVTKKAPIPRPADQITIDAEDEKKRKEKEPEFFMIPLSNLLAFQTLVKEHSEKAKALAKTDPGHLYIEIGHQRLESFGDEVTYNQPVFNRKDFEAEFEFNGQTTNGLVTATWNSKDLDACNKGFSGSSPVKMTYCGDDFPLHFQQEKTDFEALLVQRREDSEDED